MLTELSVFGELERLIAEDLYPYRYIVTAILILGGVTATAFAIARGAHIFIWRHRLASAAVAAPLLVVSVVAGNYFLSPLWERSFLDEPAPVTVAEAAVEPTPSVTTVGPTPIVTPSPQPAQPVVALMGEFMGADDFHFGRGRALIIPEGADGKAYLRFEEFSVRNGPDLYVYLSYNSSGGSVDETLNLGGLKATDGAFNYEIPASIDLARVESVVVWCRQFSVLFAIAPLE